MAKSYTDLLTSFPLGMNSGVAPLLLPKTQLAMLINGTVRGGLVGPRPPVTQQVINYGGNVSLQAVIQNGFMQGAAVYRPDFGNSQIVAQIDGRLFAFTQVGGVWSVAEITIPGDQNSPTAPQVWMWQSEKWLIISDGTGALPIFYDGVSCRRSFGDEHVLDTATSTVPPAQTVPAVGSNVQVLLTTPWTYGYGFAVSFNGAFYLVLSPGAGSPHQVILTNVDDTPANIVSSGTDIIVNQQIVGYLAANATSFHRTLPGQQNVFDLVFTSPHGLSASDVVTFDVYTIGPLFPKSYIVEYAATPTTARVYENSGSFGIYHANAGTQVTNSSAPPSVIVAITTAPFTVPAVGAGVTVNIDRDYTGISGQLVFVNGKQYTIVAVPPPSANSLILENLTDTAGGNYTFNLDILSIAELPAGRMGAYGLGQNWLSLVDGQSFMCSDLVNSGTGSPAYSGRDAVLKAYNFSVMGSFRLPGAGEFINSMTFMPTLDTSLGQGPLEIGTLNRMFSCKAPFDLSDFQAAVNPLSTPILTDSLIGFGPMGQNSTLIANSDIMFRSLVGLSTFKSARRDMTDDWGNVPISLEVSRVLDPDSQTLLPTGSGVVFDNRWLSTCAPASSGLAIYNRGHTALNFDLVSTLRGKVPAAYDGLWEGINVTQFVTGLFGTTQRAFAWAFDPATKINLLYELGLGTGDDNGTQRIAWVFETPVIFNQDKKPLNEIIRLNDGEIYLTDVEGQVDVVVKYRPLFWPCWVLWHQFSVCASMIQPNAKKQVLMPLGLGQPSGKDCDEINNRPLREGAGFQLRVEITGLCKFWGCKIEAVETPQPKFAKVAACEGVTCPELDCDVPNDFTVYQANLVPVPPPPEVFQNVAVDYAIPCPDTTAPLLDVSCTAFNPILTWTQTTTPDNTRIYRAINAGSYVLQDTIAGALLTWTDPDAVTLGDIRYYKIQGVTGGVNGNFSLPVAVDYDFALLGTSIVYNELRVAYNDLFFDNSTLVTSVSLAGLKCVGNNTYFDSTSALVALSLPELVTVGASFFTSSSTITGLSCPKLTTVAGDILCDSCAALTTVNLPLIVFHNGQNVRFDSSALNATSIAAILARAIVSGVTTATFNFDAGTNAAFGAWTAQAQADYATLIGLGNTITFNP